MNDLILSREDLALARHCGLGQTRGSHRNLALIIIGDETDVEPSFRKPAHPVTQDESLHIVVVRIRVRLSGSAAPHSENDTCPARLDVRYDSVGVRRGHERSKGRKGWNLAGPSV